MTSRKQWRAAYSAFRAQKSMGLSCLNASWRKNFLRNYSPTIREGLVKTDLPAPSLSIREANAAFDIIVFRKYLKGSIAFDMQTYGRGYLDKLSKAEKRIAEEISLSGGMPLYSVFWRGRKTLMIYETRLYAWSHERAAKRFLELFPERNIVSIVKSP